LKRFNLGDQEMPRALSEENMIVERCVARATYILGSRQWVARPRYELQHDVATSPMVEPGMPYSGFLRTGGVLVHEGKEARPDLGEPVVQWTRGTAGVYVYCSEDVRARLGKDGAATRAATQPRAE
jgi:hypothetical protein